jgi:hypothetical protein
MAYGHAERTLAAIRLLEAETRELLSSQDRLDPEAAHYRRGEPGGVRQVQMATGESAQGEKLGLAEPVADAAPVRAYPVARPEPGDQSGRRLLRDRGAVADAVAVPAQRTPYDLDRAGHWVRLDHPAPADPAAVEDPQRGLGTARVTSARVALPCRDS